MEYFFRILRFDPEKDERPYFQDFSYETEEKKSMLEALMDIRNEQDCTLAFRYSCREAICGSCGMVINGQFDLACRTMLDSLESSLIVIEPLPNLEVQKDLAVDMEPFFERIRSIHPKGWGKMSPVEIARELHQSPEEHVEIVDAIKCIMCGCCTSSCPVNLEEDSEYIGPAAVLRSQRYIFDTRLKDVDERMDITEKPHGVWSCMTYYKCTDVCPKGIKVTQNILNLKSRLLERKRQVS